MRRPLIGLTADVVNGETQLERAYLDTVVLAGGVPIVLPPRADLRGAMLDRLDGVIITGGDDIDVSRRFGVPLHPKADCMHPDRQEAEFALLEALDARPDFPVLGICLGMQLMGVHRGNALIQHLGDVIPNADRHREGAEHQIAAMPGSALVSGMVTSYHHQALDAANEFEVIAWSDDGLIEAIVDPGRRFYLGVQWHPELTPAEATGVGVVRLLVEASRENQG